MVSLKAISRKYSLIPFLLLIIFFINGLIWNCVLPIWEGPDEPAHFAYIQTIAEEEKIPTVYDPSFFSNELVYSMKNLPVGFHAGGLVGNYTTYSTFWHSSNSSYVAITEKRLESLASNDAKKQVPAYPLVYEAQHPPLYYLISTPIYLLVAQQSIIVKVFALRTFTILLSAIGIFIAYRTISLLTKDSFLCYGSLIFMVLNPMFVINFTRISNESLTMLLFSLFTYFGIKFLKSDLSLKMKILWGVVIGLGMISKATFLVAIPLVLILMIMKGYQENNKSSRKDHVLTFLKIKNLVIIYSTSFLISSWWYIKNQIYAGDFTGLGKFNGLKHATITEIIHTAVHLPWTSYYSELFTFFWGRFGWELIRPLKSYYEFFYYISIISLIGLLIQVFRKRKMKASLFKDWKYQSFGFLAIIIILIILGLSYENILFDISSGNPSRVSLAWYMFIAISSISVLFMLGFRTFIPKYSEKALLPLFTIMFLFNFSIIFYTSHAYYWGIYWGI